MAVTLHFGAFKQHSGDCHHGIRLQFSDRDRFLVGIIGPWIVFQQFIHGSDTQLPKQFSGLLTNAF